MINLHWSLQQIFGNALIFTSIFDALKYVVQANKIRKQKTAKGMSRRFINWAVSNDIVKLIYGIIIGDLYIILSSLLASVSFVIYVTLLDFSKFSFHHIGCKFV